MSSTMKDQQRFLTDSEVRGAVQDSLQASKDRREGGAELNRGQLIRNWTLGLGAIALISFGIRAGTGPASNFIHDKFFSGPDLQGKLKQPVGEVAREVREGDIDRDEVTTVTVGNPQSAWEEAAKLTGDDHPTEPVADIIEEQQGDQLVAGDHAIVPTDAIEPPK